MMESGESDINGILGLVSGKTFNPGRSLVYITRRHSRLTYLGNVALRY